MLRRLLTSLLLLVIVLSGILAGHLALVWWSDPAAAPPAPEPGKEDVSRFSLANPARVVRVARTLPEAEAQLAGLVRQARAEGGRIAIAGARHSMGGHTMADGAVVVDMTPLNFVDEPRQEGGAHFVTVGAGALWRDVLPRLQAAGLAVQIMQSNNDFTVGGSLSVNCHGWQHGLPPIASSVVSLRVVTADGGVAACDAHTNDELFRHVLGGYGLFGIITQATLRVVKDAHYKTKTVAVTPESYWKTFQCETLDDSAGMAYGRINVAPLGFLESGTVNVLRLSGESPPKTRPAGFMPLLKRLVFRGSVGSGFGKQVREWGERLGGELDGGWRSVIQGEPASDFGSRRTDSTEILQEYFVPVRRLGEFITRIRPLFEKHRPVDLLNITVRDVKPDETTALPYAREHVFGLVMLFHMELGPESDERMRAFSQDMIEEALACGGTYYLTYRPHATREQFARAYPMAADFFETKRRLDPGNIFRNQFLEKYGPGK